MQQDRNTVWQGCWAAAWLVCVLLWIMDDIYLFPSVSRGGILAFLINPLGLGTPVLILATPFSAVGYATHMRAHPKGMESMQGTLVFLLSLLSLLALAGLIAMFVLGSQYCQQHPVSCSF